MRVRQTAMSKMESNFEIHIDVKLSPENCHVNLSNACCLSINKAHTALGRLAAHFRGANHEPARQCV